MSMTKRRIFSHAVMAASLAAAVGSTALVAASCTERVPCSELVGSYVTTVTDREGVFSSRGLMTFTSDGIVLMSDSAQGGVPGLWDPFSAAQGVWKCRAEDSEKLDISALGLNFVLPPDGRTPSFARVDYEASLDIKTGTLSGSATLHFTPDIDLEGGNPVTKPGPEVDAFDFEGERVVIKE